ncbi:MAG: hypothetical protein IKR05_09565 [Prevotella sp.]|nr:hypothetical protein [Prevotella sp.]
MNRPWYHGIKNLWLQVGILLVADLVFLFLFYFHPVEYQDGLGTLFFAVILCGLNVIIGMRKKSVWGRAFLINGFILLFGVWKSAGLSNELYWNYCHKEYSIEVNGSTFKLEMDMKEKTFKIWYHEKPYDVGYYSGCFMETGYNEYSLFVDTMYSVKKDVFNFSFRNDTLINFRPKPIKIERTSIEVNSLFVDD